MLTDQAEGGPTGDGRKNQGPKVWWECGGWASNSFWSQESDLTLAWFLRELARWNDGRQRLRPGWRVAVAEAQPEEAGVCLGGGVTDSQGCGGQGQVAFI